MNQEKIGKFIAELRKEKNMTQKDLADKLNITDRAIGNWESGRRLPDYSLLQDLCAILGVTINELLSGEKVEKDKYIDKAEENFINLKKKVDRVIKIICIMEYICVAFVIILFFVHMYFNSVYRGPWDDSNFSIITNVLILVGTIFSFITEGLKYEAKK